jgi:hypothetical protein
MSVLKPLKTAGKANCGDVSPHIAKNALIACVVVGIPNALIASVQRGQEKWECVTDRMG